MTGRLAFSVSPLDAVVFALALFACLCFAVRSVRQSSRRSRMVVVELWRVLAVALLAGMLLEPEWIREREQFGKPALVILEDRSPSMRTTDVPVGEGSPDLVRAEASTQLLDDFLIPALGERFETRRTPFSGTGGSTEGTDIASALTAVLDGRRTPRAVLLVSDGEHTMGVPPSSAALRLRAHGVPVFTLAVGRDSYRPDIAVMALDVPSFCVLNERVVVPFRIANHLAVDVDLLVKLEVSDGQSREKRVKVAAGAVLGDSFVWQPLRSGRADFVLSVPVQPGETDAENNRMTASVDVRHELIRVLVVESRPRWEYRFLRNALQRDPGIRLNTLLLQQAGMSIGGGEGYLNSFPDTAAETASYDVVVLGDVGVGASALSGEQAGWLRMLVEKQAGGIVFLPGRRGTHATLAGTPLEDLYPVVLDPTQPKGFGTGVSGHLALTHRGADHLLLRLASGGAEANRVLWKQLPGFHWYAPVVRAKPGTDVLGVHATQRGEWGRRPLIVTRPFGHGQVLFLGVDSAWRWRKGVEDRYHYRFWGQVMRWMAHRRHMKRGERGRLFHTPETPVRGDSVHLNITLLDQDGFQFEPDRVSCRVTAPSGKAQEISLVGEKDAWGAWAGSFPAEEAGEYALEVNANRLSSPFEAKIVVGTVAIEPTGRPARPAVLREIARLTGGASALATPAGLASVVAEIRALPEPEATVERTRLWCAWWWGAAVLALLALHWVGRKLSG
ncbi:MAG: VWA domain-containing protein, partial [Lentisphaeria bacterium]|nr:VWA domain-containing protein [Lentisphaeria bacterium]